jgi:hypothetical protein
MGGGFIVELGEFGANRGATGEVVDGEEWVRDIRGGGRGDTFGKVVLDTLPEVVCFQALEGCLPV